MPARTRAPFQLYLAHKNGQHTLRYTDSMLKSSNSSYHGAPSANCAVKPLICHATYKYTLGAEYGGKLVLHTGLMAILPSVMYYFTVT
jgi:hypothetical protein